MCYFGDTDLPKTLGVTVHECLLEKHDAPLKGWVAASTYYYEMHDPDKKLKNQPYASVGKSIRLYYFKP